MTVSPFLMFEKRHVILIIMIFLSGCATREDFRQSFIARYVRDGVYTNAIKGFSLQWPEKETWIFRNYPEFDLSFDHIDGRSQVLVIGVNRLIRKDFPDGFHQWIMDRLQVHSIEQVSHETLTGEDLEKFRIITRCQFSISGAGSLGIHRQTDALLMQKGNRWVAVMCICPVEYYEQREPLFQKFFSQISML